MTGSFFTSPPLVMTPQEEQIASGGRCPQCAVEMRRLGPVAGLVWWQCSQCTHVYVTKNNGLTLTAAEIEYVTRSIDGLEVAMDYHDQQMCMGEPMGFDCQFHRQRYAELQAERDRLRQEWCGGLKQEQQNAK